MPVGSAAERAAQLVVEIDVTSLDRSLAFYLALGFSLERRAGAFAALRFGEAFFFLSENVTLPKPSGATRANLRVMVPDVDGAWQSALSIGATVERAIGDRSYGLRDFSVIDPDGFGLRFASVI